MTGTKRHDLPSSFMIEESAKEIEETFEEMPPPPTERAARYLAMRKCGMGFNSRLFDVDGLVHPFTAARAMGIPRKDRTLVFDGDWEMDVLTEYSFYFHLSKGKRHIDRFLDSGPDLTPDEKAHLNAQRKAVPSVFETAEVRPDSWETDLVDMLGDRGTVTIVDRNWSSCARPGILSYMRILSHEGFSCTSGISLPLWVPGDSEQERRFVLRRCAGALRTPGKRTPAHSLFYMCRQLFIRSGLEIG